MDFMKVFDQTVRDIKREVNLRVLKVPEIEQKVLDATNDEPWGPHGSALAELARETKKYTECQIIMNALWTRLSETGANWRNVYKALAVIEYLVANGAERALDNIIDHTFQISSLSGFEYVEPNGKDLGINVRKKVETILGILNDSEKIKAVRDKAAATRDKYFGLSSSGISYKSSSSLSIGSNGYGGFGGSREGEKFNDTCTYRDHSDEEFGSKRSNKDEKSQTNINVTYSERNKPKKGIAPRGSSSRTSTKQSSIPSVTLKTQKNDDGDGDDDDFDPRGSSTTESTFSSVKQMDLFGDSMVGNLIDMPTSIPAEGAVTKCDDATEVDLFADASFVSAPAHTDTPAASHIQENVDLFACQTKAPASLPSQIDLFDTSNSTAATATAPKPPESDHTKANTIDPFAAVPLNNFEESDIFGSFSSNSNSANIESSQNSANIESSQISANIESSQNSANDSFISLNQSSSISSIQPTKDPFQVKSGVWADSLSRGLIDLNITAPKKITLADIGVVGELGDSFNDEKGPPASMLMGRPMGSGKGPGKSSFPSTGGVGSNFNSFK